MPGAGTDRTREWTEFGGPAIVLVEPQLGENIGAAARAMANFGLEEMRLVRRATAGPTSRRSARLPAPTAFLRGRNCMLALAGGDRRLHAGARRPPRAIA